MYCLVTCWMTFVCLTLLFPLKYWNISQIPRKCTYLFYLVMFPLSESTRHAAPLIYRLVFEATSHLFLNLSPVTSVSLYHPRRQLDRRSCVTAGLDPGRDGKLEVGFPRRPLSEDWNGTFRAFSADSAAVKDVKWIRRWEGAGGMTGWRGQHSSPIFHSVPAVSDSLFKSLII